MNIQPRNAFEVRPLTENEGGGYLVTFPDLPGCMADGDTIENALKEAVDAETSWLVTRKEFGITGVRGWTLYASHPQRIAVQQGRE